MRNLKLVVLAVVATSLAACNGIPSGYKGVFNDPVSGVTLKIKSAKAVFSDKTGRQFETKVEDLKFESLLAGGNGVYLGVHPDNSGLREFFWILPNAASRQEGGGLVWFESEVIYSVLKKKTEGKAEAIDIMHCERGTVLLDAVAKTFEVGCGEDAENLHLLRVKK